MSTFVLLTITGLGLGAMYFLIASGLSLIYGLMGVLNFAHGAFLSVGAYASWWFSDRMAGTIESVLPRFLLASLFGLIVGGVLAVLVEQNLGVVRRIARDAVVLDQGRVVHEGDARVLLADPERVRRFLGVAGAE